MVRSLKMGTDSDLERPDLLQVRRDTKAYSKKGRTDSYKTIMRISIRLGYLSNYISKLALKNTGI